MSKIMDSITLPQIVFGPLEYLFKLYTIWIEYEDAEKEGIYTHQAVAEFSFPLCNIPRF